MDVNLLIQASNAWPMAVDLMLQGILSPKDHHNMLERFIEHEIIEQLTQQELEICVGVAIVQHLSKEQLLLWVPNSWHILESIHQKLLLFDIHTEELHFGGIQRELLCTLAQKNTHNYGHRFMERLLASYGGNEIPRLFVILSTPINNSYSMS